MSRSKGDCQSTQPTAPKPGGPGTPRLRRPGRDGRRVWILLGAILLMGFVLRSAHLAEIKSSPAFKYPAYDAAFNDYWATCLASGDWSPPKFYSDPRIRETPFFRPPGYPYFLAGIYVLTDHGSIKARFIQMIIGLVSCVLAFMLGRSIFGQGAGLMFAAMMSVYWVFVYFEGELQAPVLMVLLTLATMNVLTGWVHRTTYKNTIAAGLLLGLLGLVMPNTLVLAPVALVWIWWVGRRRKDRRRFRTALVGFSLGVAVTIAPATIRNYAVSGEAVLITSNAGINLYIGNNEFTDCVTANAPILGQYTGLGSWTCFDEPAITTAVEKIVGRPLKSSEVSRFFTGKAFEHISAHPGRTLELMGRKALLFWGPAEISNNEVMYYDRAHSRVLKFLPGFPVALALAIIGAALLVMEFRGRRKREGATDEKYSRRLELVVLMIAFVAVYFASYLPFFIQGRYRIPIIPVLLLFGAYGIERVRADLGARRFKTVAIWAGVFVIAYLGARLQVADYKPDLGMWHFLRGDAYRKQAKTELARAEFAKAIESSGRPNALAYNNLGVALDQLGRQAEAVDPFEKAIGINPNFLDARRNLVSVLLRMNRADEAYRQLVEIVRLDPKDAVARSNLGVCLMMQSRLEDALEQFETAVQLNPTYVNARFYLARALAQSGRNQEAMAQLRRVLELKPDHAGARAMLEGTGSNP
jgi:Flp pilus assembly protein TadD/4-amino-4-deoxy-L-arabinose transferase-like glycosyltransferase